MQGYGSAAPRIGKTTAAEPIKKLPRIGGALAKPRGLLGSVGKRRPMRRFR